MPDGEYDVLTAALGNPEHGGRVRGLGHGLTKRIVFGKKSRAGRKEDTATQEEIKKLRVYII